MDYGLPQVIESIRNGGETPPTWLGSINVPPVFIELPFTVGSGSRFIPSATMFEVADRAQYTAMAFAGLALSAIMAWMLHTRLP